VVSLRTYYIQVLIYEAPTVSIFYHIKQDYKHYMNREPVRCWRKTKKIPSPARGTRVEMSIISRLDILPHSHFVVMFNIVETTTEGEVRLSPFTTTKTINIAPFFIAQDPCKNITSKSGLSSNSSIHSPLRQRFLEAFHEKCTGACLVGSVECTCLIDVMHWNNG